MKKFLILNASPRGKNSRTQVLVDAFVKGASTKDSMTFDMIYLKDYDIKSCLGCFKCWTNTPGKCIQKDDTESILKKYIDADVILYATPIYHYGMTSILKRFIERTLPINKPEMVLSSNHFVHPLRYDLSHQKHILISTCGFPDLHNFDLLTQQFKKITHNQLCESITCVEGELLGVSSIRPTLKWYLDALIKGGKEFVEHGHLLPETRETLLKPLYPKKIFSKMANVSWKFKK